MEGWVYIMKKQEFLIDCESDKFKDISISNNLYIEQGKTKKFENNIIHLSSIINCDGNLLFDNCVVYYNDTGDTNEINLAGDATLEFMNCKIICKGTDRASFIEAEGISDIVLQNCELFDCSYFIDLKEESKILIDSCKIENPSKEFINGTVKKGMISNCHIKFTEIPKLIVESTNDDSLYGIFNCNLIDETDEFIIEECLIYKDKLLSESQSDIRVFDIAGAVYKNCSFTNISNCISKAKRVNKSKFLNCIDVIVTEQHSGIKIDDCIFKYCERIVQAGKGSIVSSCQFFKCRNRIIEVGVCGNVTIDFCEFYNIKYENGASGFKDACLYFPKAKGQEANVSRVRNCIFNGVNARDGFLIMGDVHDKKSGITAYVEECSFKNCVTNHESEKIIKEYSSYSGLFNRQIKVNAVVIYNCRGLDKVNKKNEDIAISQGLNKINQENGYIEEDISIRDKTFMGMEIGATKEKSSLVGIIPEFVAGKKLDNMIKDIEKV